MSDFQQNSKEKSEKRERFERVSKYRVNMILHYLRLLENCSNKYQYQYSQEDVEIMFGTLDNALQKTRTAFYSGGKCAEKPLHHRTVVIENPGVAHQIEINSLEIENEEKEIDVIENPEPLFAPNNSGQKCKPHKLGSKMVQCPLCGETQQKKNKFCAKCNAKFRKWF